jgi:hypothetical protein
MADGFDNGTFDARWNGAYIREEFYTNGLIPFPQFEGHGYVMHYHIPAGQNEITPVQIGADQAAGFRPLTGRDDLDELYFEWQEYIPKNTDFADISQKMLRATVYYPDQPKGCEMNWVIQGNNTNLQLSFEDPAFDPPIDLFTNTNLSIPTDQWVTFAVWTKLN